ncbi:MAG: UvrD-helicase domain-containing protein [Clostridium sp.]|uniref:UvrD-helicase domain-containing protein n=1 Tax=Clostridium sp. TaxID=1506 RepID=UPI003F3BC098
MDLKSLLNKEQYEGASTVEGQVLILAGAGSGKTRVLTYRMAHMIDDLGIMPWKILAITFTNKAAKEMRDRVRGIIGEKADSMWISTFHSTCVRILRRDIDKLGYKKGFTIYDTSDQKVLLKECIKALNINEKDITLQEVMGKIGRAKDTMQTPGSFMKEHESNFREKKIADVYAMYQKRLKENNALDFDDLIFKTVELFKSSEETLEFYQNKFQYIMVDEYQDTNGAQYELVKMLAKRYKNICVVGDDDQCLVEGTLIETEDGEVKIEEIKEGDSIISAIGNGKVNVSKVGGISSKEVKEEIIKITTESGKVLSGTKNHITFSKLNLEDNRHFVYLMYKNGFGYRIGRTASIRSRKEGVDASGLAVRLNGEKADKMWILKVCQNVSEASYYEEYFSVKYGLPKLLFHAKGRSIKVSQDMISNLYKEINTSERAEKLMNEEGLYEEYAHHLSGAVIRGESIRKRINLTFFGGKLNSKGIFSNRIGLNSSDEESKEKFINAGFSVRDGNRNTFRIETERAEYDEAEEFTRKLRETEGAFEVVKKAKLSEGKSYSLMPLGSIREGMLVPVVIDGKVVEEKVVSIEKSEYTGKVYDLNIEDTRNYIANGVVVHNCIYQWRGADIQNILDFEKDYPNCKVIKLEQNYRSKGNILDAANEVIVNNSRRKDKALRTEQESGSKIKVHRAFSDKEEADFIAKEIKEIKTREKKVSFKDFAVLYRTNAQSRNFEECFRRRAIPYKIIGGTKFYDRKEIKDMLAYLKILVNPQDDVSIRRVINVPKRSIGAATIDKVQTFAEDFGLNFWDALTEVRTISTLTARNCTAIEKFTSLMETFIILAESMPPSVLIENILKESGYLAELEKSEEIEDKSRIENLKELVSDAVQFEKDNPEENTLTDYLENVALVQDVDRGEEEEDDYVVLMTLHSAKGLEFPYVFMVGMENGIFPSNTDMNDHSQLEEARRLCYVGITRAKESLYMTSAEKRLLFGRITSFSQSDFINEIRFDLKEFVNGSGNVKKTNGSGYYNNINQRERNTHGLNSTVMSKPKVNRSASINSSDITAGKKVKHDKFGLGTVVSVAEANGDKKLTIVFDKQGIKILMLSMANLELV